MDAERSCQVGESMSRETSREAYSGRVLCRVGRVVRRGAGATRRHARDRRRVRRCAQVGREAVSRPSATALPIDARGPRVLLWDVHLQYGECRSSPPFDLLGQWLEERWAQGWPGSSVPRWVSLQPASDALGSAVRVVGDGCAAAGVRRVDESERWCVGGRLIDGRLSPEHELACVSRVRCFVVWVLCRHASRNGRARSARIPTEVRRGGIRTCRCFELGRGAHSTGQVARVRLHGGAAVSVLFDYPSKGRS